MGDMGRINGFDVEQVDFAKTLATRYEGLGYQPLPSCLDEKKPMIPFARHWEGGLPPVKELWERHPSGNIQLMTGRYWGLCVIDLDGAEGIEAFRAMCRARGTSEPRTWVVSNHQKESRHLWFTLPYALKNSRQPLGRKHLWGIWDESLNDGKGGWKKRAGIEFLCDKCLIMAPPSIHPVKKTRYAFIKGKGPDVIPRPAILPTWVLTLEGMQPKKVEEKSEHVFRDPSKVKPVEDKPSKLPCTIDQIKEAIPFEYQARLFGLRPTDKPTNSDGWKACHDIDRPDDNPSAYWKPETGQFWSPRFDDGRAIGFFDLAVELGHYANWYDCCVDMGRKYLPHLFRQAKD
jgi:hypothetical protein